VTDWRAWHDEYDDPDSAQSARLRAVQDQVRAFLETAPPGPVHVLSACSGLGLDLIAPLEDHPRRDDVRGLLIELDPKLAGRSAELLADAKLDGLRVVQGDAGDTSSYAGAPPADLLLLCGVFGNISDEDIETTARNASRLCAPDATVVWTRHRRAPDLTPAIRHWFEQAGWSQLDFLSPGPGKWSVCVQQLEAEPLPFAPLRLFTFED
jgi:hypothetical protein